MRRLCFAPECFVVLLCLAAVPLASHGAWQDDKVVPVHQEPRHHLVFDSPGTRILDVQIPPGDTTLFHTHRDPILYVTMSTSQTRSQTLGGEWSGGETAARSASAASASDAARPQPAPSYRAAGPAAPFPPVRLGRMMSTTSYGQQPLTHRVNNLGATLYRLIGITNSSSGDASTAPSTGFDAQPEISNNWFRGYRWTLGAGAKEPVREHRHTNPVAVVLISGRAIVGATVLDQPGKFAWFDANTPHALQGMAGDGEVVEVEIRRAR